jgi:hypothetical protein
MKKNHYVVLALGFLLLSASAYAQYDVPTNYPTIQAAVNAAPTSTTIHIGAGTYNEAVTVSKQLTLIGAGATTIVTPPSGVGITVAANGVTIQSLKVTGASGSGVYASGVSNLTLTSVESDGNGNGATGSGVDVKGIAGTSVFTGIVANNNHAHGLAIGSGSTGVSVSGGTFTGNGQTGDPTTGGGIIVYANAGTTTSGTSISGTVNSNTNKTAGIYLECDPTGHVNTTTIGATGTTTLNDNGSTSGTYGTGGAAVLVHGPCDHTTIKATSVNHNIVIPTAGLVVLGTDAAGANSPTNTTVYNSTLTGFSLTSPAGTMKATGNAQTLICTTDVDATNGNNIVGFTEGFEVEDVLYHKLDDSQLGLFRGPGTLLYVTPHSGSIQRAIDIVGTYSATQINIQDGTYAENVNVSQAVVLNGQGANTIIKPSSGNGVDVTIAGVTLENLHIYLDAAFNGTFTPTATTNTFSFRVKVKALLQGGYVGSGLMRTTLATSLVPLTQPYGTAPYTNARFNYSGGELVSARSVLTSNSVTDWVLVELRATSNGAAVDRRVALLKDDGNIYDVDGTTAGVYFTVTKATGYVLSHFIVFKHRNHLPVMSAATVPLPNAAAYDFTTSQSQAFGTNPLVTLVGGFFGIPSGDVDFNGGVGATDINGVVGAVGVTTYSVYDIDMNGGVGATDINQTVGNVGQVVQVP